jgi:molybdopterin-synthase adenylyltransferase
VGVGGLGSPVAEQLVRMGVEEITIIDNDLLDTASNVRRVVGSTAADLRATVPPPKVDVVGRHLDQLGLGVRVRRLRGDVRREDVFRELLDTDVVLSGTDTHGSRAVVNDLASAYFLPVIDCGVRAGPKADGRLAALTTEIRVLTPVTPCLWCREAISSDVIRAENLPPEQRDQLAAEGYLVDGFGEPAPSVVALTFTAAGLMTSALIALLSKEGEVAPAGYIVDGLLGYVQESRPTEPRDGCLCRSRLGMGDALPPPLLPRLSREDSVPPLERGISSP